MSSKRIIICIFMITGFINYKMEEIKKRGNCMRKCLTLIAVVLIGAMQIAYSAGVTTEKEIGPCTSKNMFGFCVESKTHYCASISKSNGRCQLWYAKNKSEFDNAMEQFNKFNEGLYEH